MARGTSARGGSTVKPPAPPDEEKHAYHNLIHGTLHSLPVIPATTIRIYISSTDKDFEFERQKLWSDTLAELRLHFLSIGVDVTFLDAHQGSLIDQALDREALDHDTQMIAQCHKENKGPFFLCLLGNKYGPVPLPAFIDEAEFSQIRSEAFEAGKDIKLLDDWYIKQNSCHGNGYCLRPLHTKYKHLHSRSEESMSQSMREMEGWTDCYTSLLDMLQHSASVCYKEGLINQAHAKQQRRFFLSAVEQQMESAMQLSTSNCFVVMRVLQGNLTCRQHDGMNSDCDLSGMDKRSGSAQLYVDANHPSVDAESQARLQDFKESVASRLNEDNVLTLRVPWLQGGLNPYEYEEHQEYLESLHNAVLNWCKDKLYKSTVTQTALKLWSGHAHNFTHDLLTHYHQFRHLTGRMIHKAYSDLHDKILKGFDKGLKDNHHVMLLFGREGSGKSTIVSKVCSAFTDSMGKSVITVLRYINHQALATSVWDLLLSLCEQLYEILDQTKSELRFMKTDGLGESLAKALDALSRRGWTVVVAVDGVENLKPDTHASDLTFEWVPFKLAANIHMLLTCSNGNKPLLQRVKTRAPDKDLWYEIPSLDMKDSVALANELLSSLGHPTVPQDKEKSFYKSCKVEPTPLFVSLLTYEISWSLPDVWAAGSGVACLEDVLHNMFAEVEERFGQEIVAAVAGYITTGYHGVTEMELLDLLSSNNEVMLLIHPYSVPPVIRFPVWLWLRIYKFLRPLISEVYIDRKLVYQWSHRTVASLARQRYLQRVDTLKATHCDMANLFLETWLFGKPLLDPARGLQQHDIVCRQNGPQPLLYSETQYNMRKLSELWYHLLNTGEVNLFKENSFLNFEYLLCKMHSRGLHGVVRELQLTLGQVLDAELVLLLRCITMASRNLLQDILQLASELIGRMRQVKEHYPDYVESLILQCMEWCDGYSLPLLVPLSSWLPDPRTPLVLSIDVSEPVTQICPTRNGQHLFCATSKNDICIYHVASKKLVKTLTGHRGAVTCLQVAHSNNTVISGSIDSTLRLWDISTAKCTRIVAQHKDAILCLIVSHNDEVIVTGSRDRTFNVVSMATGEVLHFQKAHEGPVTALTLNSSDSLMASASLDKRIHIWDMEEYQLLNTIEDEYMDSPIQCMELTADNTFLLFGCEDGKLHVRSFVTGSHIHSMEGPKGKIESMAIANDSHHVALSASDKNVYIYNLRTRELLETFTGHTNLVTSLKISTDEHFLFSASKDAINVWTFYKRHTRDYFPKDDHKDEITCLSVSRDDKKAISGSKDCLVKLWNLDICDFAGDLVGHTGPVTCVALADDEAFAVSGSADMTVKVWSVMMPCIITDYKGHKSAIKQVFVLADNTRVMSADAEGAIRIWKAEDGETLVRLVGPNHIVSVAPNSLHAISATSDNVMKIWAVDGGQMVQTVNHADRITCVSYSADSQYVATGSADMSCKLWEASTGKLTQVLVEHEGTVNAVSITDSNRQVITASDDKTLIIWSLETGLVEHRLAGHTGSVTSVKVTSDGAIAVSGSRDCSVRVWSVSKGTLITAFCMHVPVTELHVTRDAAHLVVNVEKTQRLPLMCLHNKPTGEVHSQSQITVHIQSACVAETTTLPVKPHPPPIHYPSSLFPSAKKKPKGRSSVSSIPEVIRMTTIGGNTPISSPRRHAQASTSNYLVSPVKLSQHASLRHVVERQEHLKESRGQKAMKDANKDTGNKPKTEQQEKKSSICTIL